MASLVDEGGWHEWLCHTNFSFLVGASHPYELLEQAVALGYRGLAITDYDGVYGLARAYTALKKLKAVNPAIPLRMFCGAELHLRADHGWPVIFQDTVALIAQNHRGYTNLCRLMSYAHRNGKAGALVSLTELLHADVEGLVAIQPMRGLLAQPEQERSLKDKCGALREHFGGRFHMALSRQLHPAEDHMIPTVMRLARHLGVTCLLTQDVFFHDQKQKDMSDLLSAIRLNCSLDSSVGHNFVNGERHLHRHAALVERFCHLPVWDSARAASLCLAASCTFDMSELRYHYPKEMIPEYLSAQEFLVQITWKEAEIKYGMALPPKVETLLKHELSLIEHLGFADYFLTVWDIVVWARSQQILCQGRGSAANSAVCYVLGITAVDPDLFDLLFERFISVERGDPPDIDVDFEHERREEVIQYIYRRFGRDKAAMVANVITFRSRGAFRAVGKALGMPEIVIDKAAAVLATRAFRLGDTHEVVAEIQKNLAGTVEQIALPLEQWARMTARLKGFPRHLGIHSGGFVLSDRPLHELVALEPATMPGRTVMQWCKEDIEALGFFKIDILALGMLSAIRKTFSLLKSHYDTALSLATIPQDDLPTYAMIQRADTVGTFQIESRAQISMLPRLKPRDFYDLVIEVAIIRPGPIQGKMIHPYLKRRNGIEAVSFPDPCLEPILRRTLGIPIFQEQVMRIAMAVGGFSAGEADELRKNLGAFAIKGDISSWVKKLELGMRRNGLAEDFIYSLIGQLQGFAHYGFPESHAASFALLAYASSYLKCHYPAAFFAALLNSQPMGFYPPHALIQVAQHSGVVIKPICIHHSSWEAELEPGIEGKDYTIRLGLHMVHKLSRGAAERLLQQRQIHGPWTSLESCLKDTRLSRVDLSALAAAAAFRAFGIERRAALWLAEAAPFAAFLEDVDEPVDLRPETAWEQVTADFSATASSLGPHPAMIIRDEAWHYPVPISHIQSAREIINLNDGMPVIVFGMLLVRQAPPSAHGMVFATIEDETGLINLVLTPDVYHRVRSVFDRHSFLCARGRLQRQEGACSVMVQDIVAPEPYTAPIIPIKEGDAGLSDHVLTKSRNYC